MRKRNLTNILFLLYITTILFVSCGKTEILYDDEGEKLYYCPNKNSVLQLINESNMDDAFNWDEDVIKSSDALDASFFGSLFHGRKIYDNGWNFKSGYYVLLDTDEDFFRFGICYAEFTNKKPKDNLVAMPVNVHSIQKNSTKYYIKEDKSWETYDAWFNFRCSKNNKIIYCKNYATASWYLSKEGYTTVTNQLNSGEEDFFRLANAFDELVKQSETEEDYHIMSYDRYKRIIDCYFIRIIDDDIAVLYHKDSPGLLQDGKDSRIVMYMK